jgi:SrtB family sortase
MDFCGRKKIKKGPAAGTELPAGDPLQSAASSPKSPKTEPESFRGREHASSGRLFFWMGITSVLLMAILFLSAKITGTSIFAGSGNSRQQDPAKISVSPEERDDASYIDGTSLLLPESGTQYDRFSRMLVEALYINSDVMGYLTVEGTFVCCPVLQTDNNEFYLGKSIGKDASKEGSVFFDSRNGDIANDDNLVIYGSAEGAFSELFKFSDIEFYEQRGYITLDRRFWTDGVTVWKVVAAYYAEENEDPFYTENMSGNRTLTLCVKSSEGDFIIRAEPAG